MYEGILARMTFPDIDSQQVTISSAGGVETIMVKKVPNLEVVAGDDTLLLPNLVTVPQTIQSFVNLDGIVGSDIFQTSVIHIDHVNGLFEINP